MTNFCTSIEQSKKLLELGIDINTADMYWEYNHNIHTYDDIPRVVVVNNWDDVHKKDFPAWSLSALLDMWPTDTIYRPMLYKGVKNNLWHGNNNWFNNPLDAAFDIVSWLLENDKIGVKRNNYG